MVAEMGPLTAFHLSVVPASSNGLARAVQMDLIRLRMTDVEVVHLYRNHVICSTTALVQGSYLGPRRIATVAKEQAWAPGAAQAAASMCRWRLARVGGVPKAGPPHVMAGAMPVFASTVALRLIRAIQPVRVTLPLAAFRRFSACVAMRLLPELTGVPRSVTGRLAFTALPPAVMSLAADAASLGSLDLITVLVGL